MNPFTNFFGEGVCNDEGYICYFLTEIIKFYWLMLLYPGELYRLLGASNFTSSHCFWMALPLQNLKLGGNLEFSWYSCNILRYCSNRCIVWFCIPANCPAQANRKFPVQLYVKIQILFESPFWICKWANHLSFLAMYCPPRD